MMKVGAIAIPNNGSDKRSMKQKMAYKGIYNRKIKRWMDLVLAIIAIFLLIPVFILISILIVFDTGLPVFYKAERGGYHGKPFQIYKFRTMVKNADQLGGGTTALNDSRITHVGMFLRKSKLDEIPQLINIIKGEMSFVGPRPELVKYTQQYHGKEKLIFQVRPGITDYSSIAFINLDEVVGSENADEVYESKVLKKKNRLRIQYAETVSFQTDCYLFFTTVGKVMEKIVHIFTI